MTAMRTIDFARLAEQVNEPTWTESGTGLIVPHAHGHTRRRYARPVGVSLFSGAGGFDVGMHQAGFHVAAAMEWDVTAAATYMVNLASPGVQIHFDDSDRQAAFARKLEKKLGAAGMAALDEIDDPWAKRQLYAEAFKGGLVAGSGWLSGYGREHRREDFANDLLYDMNRPPVHPEGCEHFWVADIRKVPGQDILDALELEAGEVDVVFGGPPCQGFSKANKNRGAMDPRNSYIFDFARIVLELRPKTFVIENVPQLLSMVTPEGVPVLHALSRVLADESFSTYDAIRKALTERPNAAMAMRHDPTPMDDRVNEEEPDDGPAPVQGDLFAEGS